MAGLSIIVLLLIGKITHCSGLNAVARQGQCCQHGPWPWHRWYKYMKSTHMMFAKLMMFVSISFFFIRLASQNVFPDRQQFFLTVSKLLLTIIHMIIAPAYASFCVTTIQDDGKFFHLWGFACYRLIHDSSCMAGPSRSFFQVSCSSRYSYKYQVPGRSGPARSSRYDWDRWVVRASRAPIGLMRDI